jgi:hypothetical protein
VCGRWFLIQRKIADGGCLKMKSSRTLNLGTGPQHDIRTGPQRCPEGGDKMTGWSPGSNYFTDSHIDYHHYYYYYCYCYYCYYYYY